MCDGNANGTAIYREFQSTKHVMVCRVFLGESMSLLRAISCVSGYNLCIVVVESHKTSGLLNSKYVKRLANFKW